MKKYIRIFAFILALITAVSVFASCGEKKPQENDGMTESPSTDEQETVDEIFPEIDKKNYDSEFYISVMTDVNSLDYFWVKESNNTNMSNAVYERQEKVRKYLGVEIFATSTPAEYRYIEPFQTAIKNKDDSVHLMISHTYYGIDGFITGNYLMDFAEISEFDLEADYWKLDFMEGIGVNDHLYLGFSDLNILRAAVITFNKELLAKYEDQLDESVYDMVENYHWTLDRMIWLASLAYVDVNADGKTPDDDIFGISAYQSVPFIGFMQASNINLVEPDEKGLYKVSCYNEKNKQKMSDLVDKLHNLAMSDYALFTAHPDFPSADMPSGRTLMNISMTQWLPEYLSSGVEFGVLPFPMYDEYQANVGYRSLQWGGYLCLPSYLSSPTMVYETIEMMTYFSAPVNIAYYEKLLGKQVADAPQDRKMLDTVWDSVCSDLGQTYFSVIERTNLLYMLPNLTVVNRTKNLASYMAEVESSANKSLKKFMSNLD